LFEFDKTGKTGIVGWEGALTTPEKGDTG